MSTSSATDLHLENVDLAIPSDFNVSSISMLVFTFVKMLLYCIRMPSGECPQGSGKIRYRVSWSGYCSVLYYSNISDVSDVSSGIKDVEGVRISFQVQCFQPLYQCVLR